MADEPEVYENIEDIPVDETPTDEADDSADTSNKLPPKEKDGTDNSV